MSNTLSFPIRWAVHTPSNKPTPAQLRNAIRLIQPEEVDRISKFVFRRDAHSSLIGRLLLRKCVRESLETCNDQILFERDSYNKPILAQPANSDLSLNVSHQGDYVVLAAHMEPKALIGVDVMKLEYSGGKDVNEFFRLMTRQFSGNEWKQIKRPSGEAGQVKAFMRHWTLKESYVKAVGLGLNLELERIEFETWGDLTLDLGQPLISTTGKLDGQILKNWTFEEHILDAEHVAAIAREQCPETTSDSLGKFRFLTFDDLLESTSFLVQNDDVIERFAGAYFQKEEKPGGGKLKK